MQNSELTYIDPTKARHLNLYEPAARSEIQLLAVSIYDNDQITPAYVKKLQNEEYDYEVITGGRRLDAVKLLREGFVYEGKTYHMPEQMLFANIIEATDETVEKIVQIDSNKNRAGVANGLPTLVLPKPEIHYQWKELVDCEGQLRLLNVQRGDEYEEYSIGEMLFSSPQEADQILDDLNCREQSVEEKWILTEVVYTPIVLLELRKASQDELHIAKTMKAYKTLPCEFVGTAEQVWAYIADEDYTWMPVDDLKKYPGGGFYYRMSDMMVVDVLIPIPRIA